MQSNSDDSPKVSRLARRYKLSSELWQRIRDDRETGASYGRLAEKYGISKTLIIRRARREGWGAPATLEAVRDRAAAIALGVDRADAVDSERREAAIDAAAEAAAEIIRRHQAEAEQVRELLWRGLEEHRAAESLDDKRLAFETLKAAKISSETLTNLQRMERISYGLDDAGGKTEIVIERSYGPMDGMPNGNGLTHW